MICLTSLFTTLKYYPSNDAMFRERLLRYARTLPRGAGERPRLRVRQRRQAAMRFDWVPVGEYRVDVDAATVEERLVSTSPSRRAPRTRSRRCTTVAVPGSYAARAATSPARAG